MIFFFLKSGGTLTNASCLESFKIQKQPSNIQKQPSKTTF